MFSCWIFECLYLVWFLFTCLEIALAAVPEVFCHLWVAVFLIILISVGCSFDSEMGGFPVRKSRSVFLWKIVQNAQMLIIDLSV